MRVYNFSAGPSMLPMEVLQEAQRDFLDYDGSGMSVCEMSHRTKYYEAINNECIALLKELMGIPDNYSVILVSTRRRVYAIRGNPSQFVDGKRKSRLRSYRQLCEKGL